MEDDLNALVAGLELSEENQGKAKTIFESLLSTQSLPQSVQRSKKSMILNWMST